MMKVVCDRGHLPKCLHADMLSIPAKVIGVLECEKRWLDHRDKVMAV